MQYAPFQGFIAPARAACELWRTIVGLTVAYGLALLLSSFVVPRAGGKTICERGEEVYECFSAGQTLVLLYAFGFIILGAAVATRFIHGRAPITLIGNKSEFGGDFWVATKALLWLTLVLSIIPSGPPAEEATSRFVPNLPFVVWVILLPISLLAVFIQTSAEEILFRGYLMQQLAARFSQPWIWIGVPAIIFAFGHYSTDMHGESAIKVAVWAGVFALVASDLTARTGNLGAAVAFHFVNNVKGILLVSLPTETGGLSLFTILIDQENIEMTTQQFVIELGFLLVSWLAIRVGLRR